ncbi:MAG: (d)CMP kinase [Clostridia bacterium]|nr:(d)CMP kinase [Clostridia bacterium]
MARITIAIDGPSGAGKSTIAKLVAKKLDLDYIDTGAMYRAVGYKMLKEGIPMVEDETLAEMLDRTTIDFSKGDTILDGQVVSGLIRTQEISKAASDCSAFATVRKKLVELQQAMGKTKNVIMDGRDICTVVLKDAPYKFYLTASEDERARRRHKELVEKGEDITFEKVLADIKERDYNDSHRAVTPLKQAEDALLIDSSNMTIDEVVNFICDRVNSR